MATIQDIVTDALTRANIIGIGVEPGATLAADALNSLNDMAKSWANEGVDVLWTTKALSDTFPLDDKHVDGVKNLLAVRVMTDAERVVPNDKRALARKGWLALYADYHLADPSKVDDALLNMPSGRRGW